MIELRGEGLSMGVVGVGGRRASCKEVGESGIRRHQKESDLGQAEAHEGCGQAVRGRISQTKSLAYFRLPYADSTAQTTPAYATGRTPATTAAQAEAVPATAKTTPTARPSPPPACPKAASERAAEQETTRRT